MKEQKNCVVPDCDKEILAKGYCNTHYKRLKRLGTIYLSSNKKEYKTEQERIEGRRQAQERYRLSGGDAEYRKIYREQWKEKNPKKHECHMMVFYAIKSGTLKPLPCEICGESKRKILAHHEDYNQPLKIKWLCTPCHVKLHRRLEVN